MNVRMIRLCQLLMLVVAVFAFAVRQPVMAGVYLVIAMNVHRMTQTNERKRHDHHDLRAVRTPDRPGRQEVPRRHVLVRPVPRHDRVHLLGSIHRPRN